MVKKENYVIVPLLKIHQLNRCLIHSDQGVHYTSIAFTSLLKELNIAKSMSRRGNCWDNAPQESFFGYRKDELHLKECNSYENVCKELDDYFDYYNNDRCQCGLNKMTPIQYRNYLLNQPGTSLILYNAKELPVTQVLL